MSLINTLATVLELSVLPDEIQHALLESGFTLRSFVLATEEDLVKLGFRMAERRLLQEWIRAQAVGNVQVVNEYVTPQCLLSIGESVNASPRINSCTTTSVISFKNLRIDNIISEQKQQNGPICGQRLTQKLKSGELIEKAKMLFLIKVCGRYLMNNCAQKDRPNATEKQDLSKSIIDCFPILHNGTASGYGYFFDRKSFSGKLEFFVRSRRSDCNDITTLWKHSPSDR
nr:uncharacterized protein LOC124812526 [Hydra vulgaris]